MRRAWAMQNNSIAVARIASGHVAHRRERLKGDMLVLIRGVGAYRSPCDITNIVQSLGLDVRCE